MKNRKKGNRGSFRDPSGGVFYQHSEVYRRVNFYYKDNYDFLISSGLYKKLVTSGYLIPHREENLNKFKKERSVYKIIKPERIPFISYPFEWCFSQLKDASLLTLRINKLALKYEMILKDASAYNIQFYKGKPVFIDTLSFEKYQNGQIWKGYGQFCKHFLSPLLLASFKDFRLTQLLRSYIDGIPLDLTKKMLPLRTLINPKIFAHIILQSKNEEFFSKGKKLKKDLKVKKDSLLELISNLESLIKKLKIKRKETEWGEYYQDNNYSTIAIRDKYKKVKKYLELTRISKNVWDLGANDGYFSRIASSKNILTVSIDNDEEAVEKNYQIAKKENDAYLLPIFLDLNNPTPSFGWAGEERDSLFKRGPCECIFALALIHHLAITNNLPFDHIARFFSLMGRWLIIEFVAKDDSQVKKMLTLREDIFSKYTKEGFEKSFLAYFKIVRSDKIKDTERYLYLMRIK